MTTLNVYLNFDGNCEEVFTFYRSVIGGEYSYLGRFKEVPPSEDNPGFTAEEGEKIMHISLPISKETILMGSDIVGEWAKQFKPGNNFSLSLTADSKEEADRLFNGLSKGGRVLMPMASTFWGDYFGTFTDKFGINWMISFPENPQV